MMVAAAADQTQALISLGAPLFGGGLLGFCVGWALKKITKLAFVAIGLVILLLAYLEYQRWIAVHWTIVENQTQSFMVNMGAF